MDLSAAYKLHVRVAQVKFYRFPSGSHEDDHTVCVRLKNIMGLVFVKGSLLELLRELTNCSIMVHIKEELMFSVERIHLDVNNRVGLHESNDRRHGWMAAPLQVQRFLECEMVQAAQH